MTVLPFEQPALTGITPVEITDDESHIVEIGVGLAAAYLAYRWWVKGRLAEHRPGTPEESRSAANLALRGAREVWDRLARPAVLSAYTAAGGNAIAYPVVERMAQAYVNELGDYVDATSVDALVEGFTAQISNGWGDGIAWMRASEGYGLDGRQMRSYLSGLMAQDKTKYTGEPIPPGAIKKIDTAVLQRADRIGMNESRKAVQMGKNMVWLAMAAQGDLPPGTMKKWVTAEDERVCVVCGPLDQVTIPLHQQFESAGQKFYAPVVHPNCRCNLEIVYPPLDVVKKDVAGDPYTRNRNGEFAVREERTRLVGDKQQIRLVPQQREQTQARLVGNRRTSEQTRIVGQQARIVGQQTRIVGEKVSLRPIEEVVEEVEQIADDATAAGGNALKAFDEPAYLPAQMTIRQQHPEWFNEYFERLIGRHITLENNPGYTVLDTSGPKDEHSEAFFNAIDAEAAVATLTAVGRNRDAQRQEDNEGGGIAVRSGIAPAVYYEGREEEYDEIRDAMAGMSHKQLVNGATDILSSAAYHTPAMYFDLGSDSDQSELETDNMVAWFKTLDATTLAAEIFLAYHREQQEIDSGNLPEEEAGWTGLVEIIKDAAKNGDKRGVFNYSGVGRTNKETADIYLFRVQRWLGDKPANNLYLADTDLASVSGVYEIVEAESFMIPRTVMDNLTDYGANDLTVYDSIRHVVVLDLKPVGLPDRDD